MVFGREVSRVGVGWRRVEGFVELVRFFFFYRWGAWSGSLWCFGGGFLVVFSFRVEVFMIFGDNTVANNVRFRCFDGTVLEGFGLVWGDYGDWSDLCFKGVCGL